MEEKTLLAATLCFLVRGQEVLLARKLKKIGAGCWNGYGGGIEEGETPLQAAVRELRDESGVVATQDSLEESAAITFHNTKTDGSTFSCVVHVYLCRNWQGEPRATEEMNEPTWFPIANLPLSEMMPADRQWLPMVLAGSKVVGEFSYGPFQKELLGPGQVEAVAKLPG